RVLLGPTRVAALRGTVVSTPTRVARAIVGAQRAHVVVAAQLLRKHFAHGVAEIDDDVAVVPARRWVRGERALLQSASARRAQVAGQDLADGTLAEPEAHVVHGEDTTSAQGVEGVDDAGRVRVNGTRHRFRFDGLVEDRRRDQYSLRERVDGADAS